MRTTIIAVLAVLTLGLCSVALWASGEKSEQFPSITISDLKEAMAAKSVTLLDANGTDMFKEGHIPGAIDFTANADDLAKVLPSDKNALIVAYCGGPQCPLYKAAAAKAKELGYTNVKHLTAGISGWKDAGEKVEKAS